MAKFPSKEEFLRYLDLALIEHPAPLTEEEQRFVADYEARMRQQAIDAGIDPDERQREYEALSDEEEDYKPFDY